MSIYDSVPHEVMDGVHESIRCRDHCIVAEYSEWRPSAARPCSSDGKRAEGGDHRASQVACGGLCLRCTCGRSAWYGPCLS